MTVLNDPEANDLILQELEAHQQSLEGRSSTLSAAQVATTNDEVMRARIERAKRCLDLLWNVREQQAPRPVTRELPKAIGRFQILAQLGTGGFGIVYRALDPATRRQVALKIPRIQAYASPEMLERFQQEATATAKLEHPNIVPVLEAGLAGSIPYIASNYYDGPTLAQWLAKRPGPVSAREGAELVRQLALAAQHAHDRGVLHRDIKPSNVLLAPRGSAPSASQKLSNYEPKLMDFGLAKLTESAYDLTRSGAIVGTVRYMSPEQARGDLKAITTLSEVYSLGVCFYELMTGQLPFESASDVDLMLKLSTTEPRSLRRLQGDVPADLETICLKCLEKEPARRYRSAAELADDLGRFLAGEPIWARPAGTWERLNKWVRRRPALAGLVGVSVVATMVVAAMTAFYVSRLQEAHQAAETSAEVAQEQEEVANRYLYASRMRLGYELAERGDAEGLAKLLEPYESGSPLADRRGFEWYHLKHRLHLEQFTFTEHRGEVYKVLFSPDGGLLVSGGQDGVIYFWDPASGKSLGSMVAHDSCTNDLSFSPDGRILASVSCDHTVKLWQVATRELIATLDKFSGEIHSVAFSPNGRWLMTGSHDHYARIWDIATREVICALDTMGSVNSSVWLDEETVFVSAAGAPPDAQSHVFKWHIPDGAYQVAPQHANGMVLSPDGDDLIAVVNDGVQAIKEFSTRNQVLHGHAGQTYGVASSVKSARVASGSEDNTIRIWDWKTARCEQTFLGHTDRVQAVAFSPDGQQLASAGFDSAVKLWDLRLESDSRLELAAYCQGFDRIPVSAISSDCRTLALATGPRELALHEITTGRLRRTKILPSSSAIPLALQVSSVDSPVVLGYSAESQQIWRWDTQQESVEELCRVPVADVVRAYFAPDGQHLILITAGKDLVAVDLNSRRAWFRKNYAPYESSASEPCFSPDGKTAFFTLGALPGSETGYEAVLLDLTSRSFALRNNSALIGISNRAQKAVMRLFDQSRYEYIFLQMPHSDQFSFQCPSDIQTVVFSPDARTFATGERRGEVGLWNSATGQRLAHFSTAPGTDRIYLHFSSDGRMLSALAFESKPEAKEGAPLTLRVFTWSGVEGL